MHIEALLGDLYGTPFLLLERERDNLSPSFWFSIFIHYFFCCAKFGDEDIVWDYSFYFHVITFL